MAKSLVDQVEYVLPLKIKDKLEQNPVSVEFINLGDIYGAYSTWSGKIMVNTLMLAPDGDIIEHRKKLEEKKGQDLARHKDIQSLRLATILHEVVHHYDRSHFKQVKRRKPGETTYITRNVRAPISGEDWFKNAMGLPTTGLFINTRTKPEKVDRRSPDPYEWKSSAEGLAVNMEFFLLDENYKCNRPFQYRFYSKIMDHNPFPGKHCENSNKVFSLNHALMGANPLIEVDPERVYGLHYFFAGEGEAAMSRFGHAMLRLVVCKPGRALGPDCLKDLSHHLVLSYAALIDDGQISTLKGLKGDYASVLNVSPLTHTLQKYTETELREVYSYPTELQREKIEELLGLLQERHWNYAGNYKFLSNNCADETLGFLKALFYDRQEIAGENVSRPDTLRDLLRDKNIIDTEVLADKERAKAEGYYFPSNRHFYQEGLNHLYNQGLLTDPIEVEDYFKTNLPFRREIIEAALATDDLKILAYTIALERVIYKKEQMAVIERAKKEALQNVQTTEELKEGEFTYLVAPVMMLNPAQKNDYGIPSIQEMEELQEKMDDALKRAREEMESGKELANEAARELEQQIDLLGKLLKKLLELRRG